MTLTSAIRGRAKTEAHVRTDTAPTNAPAHTDTPDSTARYTNTLIYIYIQCVCICIYIMVYFHDIDIFHTFYLLMCVLESGALV